MIEGGPTPVGGRVTDRAVQRETSLFVVRICGAVVVRQVARVAVLGRGGEVSARVALTALQAAVGAGQRKLRLRVIEHRTCPGRRRVALRAIGREPRLLMIRIRRAVIERNMASAAIRGRVCEGAVAMALRTLHGRMRTGQRERRFCVVKGRAGPVGGAVADRAVSRESSLDVIGIRRAVIQRNMASAAARGCPREHVIDVALRALNIAVRAR